MLVGIQRRDAETRHLDTKLLPLSMEELDMSMLYILRNFGLARSLVLGMHSGIPSRSSKVDWRENSVVASVKTLRDDGSDRRSDDEEENDRFDDFTDKKNGKELSVVTQGCPDLPTTRISDYVSSLKLFANQIAVTLKPYYRICLSFIEQ